MTTTHNITLIAGQARRLLLKMTDASGAPLPEDRYAVTGRVARYGSSCAIEAAPWGEPGTLLLTIPPLVAGAWNYDIFARREDGVSSRLLEGCIEAEARVTPPAAPEHTAAETVTVELSDTVDSITVTVTEITAVAEADWEAIREAADRAEDAAATAAAVLPTLEADVAEAKRTIEAAATTAAEQAAAEASVLVAATGAEVQTAVRTTAADATAGALEAIASAEATAINQAINNGINAIGQSISSGTGTINAATSAGKSEINQTVTNGMALLDGYVGTVSDDIARKSQPNIWGGVQTINAPLVANGGIIMQPTSSPDSVGTHMSAWLWGSTSCTERAIPYTGKWTAASWAGNALNYETYTLLNQSSTPQRTTCLSRLDVASIANYRNSMAETKSRLAVGFEARNASTYTPHPGIYPWDWATGDELRIVDTPRHAVRCMMIRRASGQQTAWRIIYPGKLDDLLSLQIISRGTEWHAPVYVGCHASGIYAVECSYRRDSNPAVTIEIGQYSSILAGGGMWINRIYFTEQSNQDRRDLPPAVTIYAHAIPLRNWTTHKRWPEETALLNAANKSWVDWRYIAAILDYTPAAAESVIVAPNIGRHIYASAAAQDIGLAASAYRPAIGGGILLPDGVVVDIDTASTWLTHSGGALHLAANTTGAERIASVWLYSDTLVGTILELQIHQSA